MQHEAAGHVGHERTVSPTRAVEEVRRQGGRTWDLVHLLTPWCLLAISAFAYFTWSAAASEEGWWPEQASVLILIIAAALWVLFGSTLPILRGSARPVPTAIYFAGLLAVAGALMQYSDLFLIFTITGFFHAYLLRPWQLGLAGVVATSVVLNGMTMRIWAEPSGGSIAQFLLIVVVQSAAIGAGILLALRGEADEARREELVARLQSALHENAGLHAQLVVQAREAGADDERQRFAREIHDTLAQGLAGIITQLQAAQALSAQPDPHVTRALDLARSSLIEARRSVRALAPEELAVARLPEALDTLVGRWAEDSGVAATFEVTGESTPLSPAIEVVLFRVAQEALTNVAKHAAASRVGVTLSYTGPEVLLDVRDDGRGFDDANSDGFGLTSMRQRIRGVGGRVEVQGAPGEGAAVSASVPAITAGASEGET